MLDERDKALTFGGPAGCTSKFCPARVRGWSPGRPVDSTHPGIARRLKLQAQMTKPAYAGCGARRRGC